jgi:hypothetical protein
MLWSHVLPFSPSVRYEPMGSLCLGVAIAEYFHRRADDGGGLRAIPGV